MGLARASGEVARALVGAAGQMASASQLLKAAGRRVLGWVPARAEQVLRGRHLASIVARELDAVTVPSSGSHRWQYYSRIGISTGLPCTLATRATALAEQQLLERLSRWYAQWSSPDALWRE